MLLDIRLGKIHTVIVYKLDRLSRSQKDTLTLIEDEFISNDVDFISVNENFDTSTPFGRAMIGMLSVFAQLEKDQITERMQTGKRARARAGYYCGAKPHPIGYDYVDGLLKVNPYEAMMVREIFQKFLDGMSTHAISIYITEKYRPTASSHVYRILNNPIYIGLIKYDDELFKGIHEPIIPEVQFNEVKRLLNSRKGTYRKSFEKYPFRAEHLLTGVLRCGQCGSRYCAVRGKYYCYSRSKTNKKYILDPNCKNDYWPIEELDKLVISSIQQLLQNKALLNETLAESAPRQTKYDFGAAEQRLKEVQAQIARLLDLYQVGDIPMENIKERLSKLSAERDSIITSMDEAKDNSSDKRTKFLDVLSRFQEEFDDAPIDAKRLYVSTLIDSITLDGREVRIKWRV